MKNATGLRLWSPLPVCHDGDDSSGGYAVTIRDR